MTVIKYIILILVLSVTSLQANDPFYIRNVKTNRKIVALTFDDGPHPIHTRRILSILQTYHVPATFFMLGRNVQLYPDIAREVQLLGHEIGNHSNVHTDFFEMKSSEVYEDIQESQRIFYETLHTFPLYFRPPYGNLKVNDVPAIKKYFLKSIKWNVDSEDWHPNNSTDKILENVKTQLKPGSIILCHDTNAQTVLALPEIITFIHDSGYRIIPLGTLLTKGKYSSGLIGKRSQFMYNATP